MDPAVSTASLALVISRLRRRAWLVRGGEVALVGGLAALAVVALASLALGFGLGDPVRGVAGFALVAVVAAAAIVASRRAGGRSDAALARELEDRDPRAAGLTTAVELAAALSGSNRPGSNRQERNRPERDRLPFSETLARAHIDDAARRTILVGPNAAFPLRSLRPASVAAGGGALFFLLALVASPQMSTGLRALVLGPGTQGTPAPKVSPITGDIALTYVYPRYTGLPPKTVQGTNGEITALRGTEVHLETRADRQVAKAWLETGGAATALDVEGGRQLSGRLAVQGSGSYAFRFEDERGRTLATGPAIPITVVEDGIPTISIDAPVAQLVVTERDSVELRFEAEDDFGVAAVELVYQVAGGEEQRIPVGSWSEPKPRAGGSHVWEMSTLGVRPGDAITYYLRAKDNDAVSGPKWGQSRTQRIEIFSEAEHRRELIAKVEEAWEKMILVLGDRITPREGPRKVAPEARVEAGQPADDGVREVTSTLQDVAKALSEDELAPQELLAAVRNLGNTLATKGLATRELRGRARQSTPRARDALLPRLDAAEGDEQRELEQGVLYLEALLDRQRLVELEELSQELASGRRELANLLEQYRGAPGDEAKEAIRQELSRLKGRMAELMKRMSRLGKGIQDEHLNAEAMQALSKERDMMSQLDEVERLMAEGKTDEALSELQKLGQRLDEMSRALNDATKGQVENDPAMQQLADDMEKFEKDLNELERDQDELAKATQNLKREQADALRQKLGQQGGDLLGELRAKIEQARAHLAKIPAARMPYRMVDDLGGATERLEDLQNALAAKDFDAAQESAASALAHAQSLEQELAMAMRDRFAASEAEAFGKLHGHASQATPLVREVKEKLDQLVSSPSQRMSGEQQERARRLAQRQSELGQRMEQLQGQAQKIGQQAPIFDDEARQRMSGAGRSMAEAESKLRGHDPGGALASERSAREHLQALKAGMEQAKENASKSGGGGSGVPVPFASGNGGKSGGRGQFDGKEKVAIPNADQYKAPEEFRKDILDAMKKDAPEGFQDPVRDYYQEIVK
ncbi:DUF4175 family protein [Vulgatibacter incomptus]|uniref:Plectin 1 isoform 8 n=1 Tax=Vulgatibacter incomptus TaxID=1391653 RepID=A0A0K1PHS2_9BACT|nr:DUF4175 family protein [Vulgatibacter incomptus]AKU93088.1 plectin 1 isoform 8 [Vulgatibacter incomptus]